MSEDIIPFMRSMHPIPSRVESALSRGVIDDSPFPISDIGDLLDNRASLVEDGVLRNPDGSVTVACRTEMHRCTPEMWYWWMLWHATSSDRYRLWHPKAHVRTAIVPSEQSPTGNVNQVDEFLGNGLFKFALTFVTPDDLGLDSSRFTTADVGGVLSGHVSHRDVDANFGVLVHLFQNTAAGLEMRSRFFIDMNQPESIVPSQYDVANPLYPPRNATERLGLLVLRHCAEEMNHLAAILPELYDTFRD